MAGFRHPPPLGIAAKLRPRPSEMRAHIPNMTSGRARPEPRQRVPPSPPLPGTRTVPSLRCSQQPTFRTYLSAHGRARLHLRAPRAPHSPARNKGSLQPPAGPGRLDYTTQNPQPSTRTTLPRILGQAPGLHLPGCSARPEASEGAASPLNAQGRMATVAPRFPPRPLFYRGPRVNGLSFP